MVDYHDTERYKQMLNSSTNAAMMRDATAQLLRVAHLLSPSLDVQKAFTQLVQNAETNGKSRTTIIGSLLAAMIDGVSCGGWPDNNGL